MTEPLTTLDPRYSQPGATATPWDATRAALEAAELAWLVTLRPDGRPHATPLVPVWLEDCMYFATGAAEQKGKNLRADDRVLLQVGGLDWERGLDIAVEGRASLERDPAVLARLVAEWRRRWDGSWDYELKGDRLHHRGSEVLTYSVRPQRVLAFAEGKFAHTLHRF
jgi:general stress protein 26